MNTPKTLKQSVIDHLAGLDLNKMSIADVGIYTTIVGQLNNMEKPDMIEALAKMSCGFGANAAASVPAAKEG